MAYTKLFSSLLNSTVWTEPIETRVVWITMLAMSDQDGNVHARAPGIAKAAGVSRPAVDAALATFLAPDPDSRTKDFEGRRIEETAEGFHLLNYEAYRDRASKEDKLAKAAARQDRWRKRNATRVTNNAPVTHANAPSRDVTRVTHSVSSQSHLISSASHLNADTDQSCDVPPQPASGPAPRRTRRKQAPPVDPTAQQMATAAIWDAYRVGYKARYDAEPLRNAKVNGQIAQLAKRIPHDEAPAIVVAYLRSQNARYVASGHAIGPLLQDAEAVRTEALTGRSRTAWGAHAADKRDGRAQDYEDLFAELRAHDEAKAAKEMQQ